MVKKSQWIVMSLKSKVGIELLGRTQDLELNWAKGMSGCIPVFELESEALNYSNGMYEVLEIHAEFKK